MNGHKDFFYIFLSVIFLVHFIRLYGHTYPSIPLSQIDTRNFTIVKWGIEQNAKRTTYKGNDNNYYKIWDVHFWRSPFFIRAIEQQFYDDTNSCISAIIYDDQGKCRGYVSRAGQPSAPHVKINKGALLPMHQQPDPRYRDFINILINKTKATRLVYIDLTHPNIVIEEDRYRIIDLEPVLPIQQVGGHFFNDPIYPADYKEIIRRIKSTKRHKPITERTQHLVCYFAGYKN